MSHLNYVRSIKQVPFSSNRIHFSLKISIVPSRMLMIYSNLDVLYPSRIIDMNMFIMMNTTIIMNVTK
jgi:hypothetical protein